MLNVYGHGICQPISMNCHEGFNHHHCHVLEISGDFNLFKQCSMYMDEIEEIRIIKDSIIEIEEDYSIDTLFVIESNVSVTIKQPKFIVTKALLIEKDAQLIVNELLIQSAIVENKGKISISTFASIVDKSMIHFGESSKIEILQGNFIIKDDSELTTDSSVEFLIDNNMVIFDTSKVTLGEMNKITIVNQLQVADQSTMTIGTKNTLVVKGYYITVTQEAHFIIEEETIVTCENIYAYFNSQVEIKEKCTITLENIFLFQEAHFITRNQVTLNVKKTISSYSLATIEFGNDVNVHGSMWYVLYNTTAIVGDHSTFSLKSFEMGGYTNVMFGKNVSFAISGDHLSPVCKQNKTATFCYSVIMRGASHLTYDNIKGHRPLFNVEHGNVLQWNTTTIELKNNDLSCIDFYSFKEPFDYPNEVEKKEYSLTCNKHLGRYCIDKKDEEILCSEGLYHCPCTLSDEIKTEL